MGFAIDFWGRGLYFGFDFGAGGNRALVLVWFRDGSDDFDKVVLTFDL